MRLLTWNCCRGRLAVKGPPAQALSADLVVLQECARPKAGETGWLWFGDNPRQGIGIWAAPGYRLRPLPARPGVPPLTIPIRVTRPRPFLLLAVWAQKDPKHPYVRALIRAVEVYHDLIASQPTVILGDFNSNARWNRTRADARDHAYLVRLLTDLKLVSAYHVFHREEHGAESRPTFYLVWNEAKPYHLDYCFIPKTWQRRLADVHVGSYADWKQWSDHRPVVVDLLDRRRERNP